MSNPENISNPEENVQVVKQFYAALGKGNIPGVLDLLAEDVEWEMPHPREIVPFGGIWRGREEVGKFFAVTHEYTEFKKVELREYIAQNNKVVVLGYTKVLVRANQREYDNELVAIWTVENGKIKQMRDFMDTVPAVSAFRGE